MKNSCLKSKSNGYCSEPEVPKNATLRELVAYYIKVGRPRLKGRLAAFKTELFDVALEKAALAKEINENDHRFVHLHRLKVSALKEARRKLLKQQSALLRCKTFDELYQIVSRVVAAVTGLGPMYAYDVALRIAANRRLKPKSVYLQRGVRTGAENLLVRKVKEQTLECSVFPAALRCLSSMEIEDFLCIFKNRVKDLKH